MAGTITSQELRQLWVNKNEVALIDVREEGPYSIAHPFFAVTIPVSEIEVELPALVPRLSTHVVVYDDGESYVDRAATRILALGYTSVDILEGGLSAYAKVGEVFRDVNVPSKAFGELVESIRHTPSLPAHDVKALLEKKEDVVVLDARRFSEYHTMTIPNSQSCPGGELLYRVLEAAPSPDTTVLVHCAGRTRSIIGTQTLVNSGIPNKVFALRNGTIGWTLAGLNLDHNKEKRAPEPSESVKTRARQSAHVWAEHVGVPIIDNDKLRQLTAETETRNIYLLDVRDPEEYAAGHRPGFISAPGGQLVQATDEWVGVRGARIILCDTDGIRARMTGSWLVQLGWEAYVLDEMSSAPNDIGSQPSFWTESDSGSIKADDYKKLKNVSVVDLSRSPKYEKGHIPGAWFASGPELVRDIKKLTSKDSSDTIVLVSPDGKIAASNLEDIRTAFPSHTVLYLAGGTQAYLEAGGTLEKEGRWLSEPLDVYKRPYEGTNNAHESMQAYLDWEYGLVAQVANDGIANFHVVRDQ